MGTPGPQLLNGGGAGRAGMRVPIVGPFFGVPSFDAAVAPLASFVSSFFPPSHGCSPKSSSTSKTRTASGTGETDGDGICDNLSVEQLGSTALDVVIVQVRFHPKIVQVHGQYDLQRRSIVSLSHLDSDESAAVFGVWSMT